MTPKLYKAAEVCDLAQLQPYVLRSWEKEFPGIGIQKSGDGQRFYRQADLDQVLKIKQLVFVEGLTVAGARRRLEEEATPAVTSAEELAEVIEVLGDDVHKRIAYVRDGLRSLLHLLDGRGDTYQLTPPPAGAAVRRSEPAPVRKPAARAKAPAARKAVVARGKAAGGVRGKRANA